MIIMHYNESGNISSNCTSCGGCGATADSWDSINFELDHRSSRLMVVSNDIRAWIGVLCWCIPAGKPAWNGATGACGVNIQTSDRWCHWQLSPESQRLILMPILLLRGGPSSFGWVRVSLNSVVRRWCSLDCFHLSFKVKKSKKRWSKILQFLITFV